MLKNEPEDAFLNYALALEYAKVNELEKAIEIIESILTKDENYLGAYYQLGQLFEQTNRVEKAINTYKKGISIAQIQKNNKAVAELQQALFLMEE